MKAGSTTSITVHDGFEIKVNCDEFDSSILITAKTNSGWKPIKACLIRGTEGWEHACRASLSQLPTPEGAGL